MDAARWEKVDDRGPHAAGILTMPVFLAKYASRRARAAAVYGAFLCKSFVSDHVDLKPSVEPNLMVREGCSTCHATLEPLAAYYFLKARNPKGRVIDPVARFHLSNGARLERVNWLGNVAPRGIQESYGIMVNYLYDPKAIEANHEAFAQDGTVVRSPDVDALLVAAAPSVRVAAPRD